MEARNYRIIRTLATGGTAVLYQAVQNSLDRQVVIKRLHPHLTADCNFTRRFEVEAKAAASLDHENIVRIIDSGVSEGNYFIVMEYIDGPSLGEIIERRGTLDPATALLVARQVCLGLEHAHRRGIVHRDIKPANIMVTETGQVKITDFGLAKLCRSQLQQTVADTLLGTPLYMSPEQAVGESIDGRSDIFSLGTVCYEMITGTQPFIGDSYAAVIQNIINGSIPPPSRSVPSIDAATERIVMKSLSRDPSRRFESAEAMAREIESAVGLDAIHSSRERISPLAGSGPPIGPLPSRRPASRRRKRRPALLLTAAALAAAAAVLAFRYPERVRSLTDLVVELRPRRAATELPETLPAAQTGSPGLALYIEPPAPAPAEAVADTAPLCDTTAVCDDAAPPAAAIPEEPPVPGPEQQPASPPPRTGLIEIRVYPEADVIIDGRLRGSTERFGPIEIDEGEHDLVLRQVAFREYSERIRIRRGELSRRRIELVPVTGELDFETVAGASIFVSGEPHGQTPLRTPIILPAGRYLVELRKHGYVTWSGEVQVPADEILRLRINLVQQH